MRRVKYGLPLMMLLLGCGGGGSAPEGLASVSGTITLDGNPLPDATVLFVPVAGGRSVAAVTDSSGGYELEYSAGTYGALPGKYNVSITTATTRTGEDGNDIVVAEKLPAKYNANTELQMDVPSDSYDFKLESGGEVYQEEQVVE